MSPREAKGRESKPFHIGLPGLPIDITGPFEIVGPLLVGLILGIFLGLFRVPPLDLLIPSSPPPPSVRVLDPLSGAAVDFELEHYILTPGDSVKLKIDPAEPSDGKQYRWELGSSEFGKLIGPLTKTGSTFALGSEVVFTAPANPGTGFVIVCETAPVGSCLDGGWSNQVHLSIVVGR